ncbi:hypothetical protein DPEC_G00084580 [Dallia pectoralis]|uniref:Uncharacterized protein n=1 Tax=Dallia pectoralis TaxID=75939 RepID=A0ACC2GZW0_DALPE|nr:hypothetical protein DPEC_G00084580 [Dallia pectoralis]
MVYEENEGVIPAWNCTFCGVIDSHDSTYPTPSTQRQAQAPNNYLTALRSASLTSVVSRLEEMKNNHVA